MEQLDGLKGSLTARSMFAFVLPQPSEFSKVPPGMLQRYADDARSIG